MVYCSLNHNTYYESQANVLEYIIRNDNGDIIYFGKSVKSPALNVNRINITEKVKNYLASNLGPGWESGVTAMLRKQPDAYGVFSLFSGELLLEKYSFIYDWCGSFTGADEILSEPVSRKLDPRMKLLWTRFGQNSANITVENGYSDIKFRYMGEKNFDFSAETRSFYYQSLNNEVIGFGTDDDWFTITKTSNTIFTISVQTNEGVEDRIGTFYITYPDLNFNVVKKYYTFIQHSEHLYIVFSGNTELGFESGSTVISFSANTMISAVTAPYWATSISINQNTLPEPIGVYTTVGTITIDYEENEGEEDRTGIVSFRRLNYPYGEIKTLELTQEHYYYFELLSDSAYTVDYEQHTIVLSADTNATSVTIQPDGNWISGTFSGGIIQLTVNENTTETGRSATISVYTNYSHNVPVCYINVLQEVNYRNVYLTMEVLGDGIVNVKQFKKEPTDYGHLEGWPIYYSKNGGEWGIIRPGNYINVISGDILRLKSGGPADRYIQEYYTTFSGTTATFNLFGNILSMNYEDNFRYYDEIIQDFAFYGLFGNSGVVDAKNVIFPSNTTSCCYKSLFYGCSELITAPEILPATLVLSEAYEFMFNECGSLQTAPELPHINLISYRGCRSMFYNCINLTKAPTKLHFDGAALEGLEQMFSHCRNLITAPEIRTTSLPSFGFTHMFYDCKKLNYIKCLATNISAEDCTLDWVSGVSSTGIFVKADEMTGWTYNSVNGIPNGWEIMNENVNYTFTIIPTPSDANVKINGKNRTSITMAAGLTVTWSVEKDGYFAQSGTYKLTSDNTKIVTLEEIPYYTFTVVPTPSDATVTINGVVGNSFTARSGTSINWSVAKTGYSTKSGTYDLSSNRTINVTIVNYSGYLSFEAVSSGTISISGHYSSSTAPKTIEYNINDSTWNSIIINYSSIDLTVVAGDVIRFRGTNESYGDEYRSDYFVYSGTAKFNVSGNILSMIYGDNFENYNTFSARDCFYRFFSGLSVVSAEYLILPENTTRYCYSMMFYNCESLVTPPILPATALSYCCYESMFYGCSNLATAPELPSTTLEAYCYRSMFSGCLSLTTAPELPAPTLTGGCYNHMFYECSNLNYVKCLATNNETVSCDLWLAGTSSTGTFVKKAGTTWRSGLSGIPEGWTVQEEP